MKDARYYFFCVCVCVCVWNGRATKVMSPFLSLLYFCAAVRGTLRERVAGQMEL
jgi:hypothetical protein